MKGRIYSRSLIMKDSFLSFPRRILSFEGLLKTKVTFLKFVCRVSAKEVFLKESSSYLVTQAQCIFFDFTLLFTFYQYYTYEKIGRD